jgi:hypothetical protein
VSGKRWTALLAVAVAGFLVMAAGFLFVVVAPAGAADRSGSSPVRASYRGSMIDLSAGWRGAQTCAVFSRVDVRCFATNGEADAVLGYSRASDPLAAAAAVPACASGWLCLYAEANGGGRRLIFHDEYWQYLSDYGFDAQTSSWRNNQGSSDAGALSMYNRSTVYTCGANAYTPLLGVYDNQAYAVWG